MNTFAADLQQIALKKVILSISLFAWLANGAIAQNNEPEVRLFDTVKVHDLYSDRIPYNCDNSGSSVQIIRREEIRQLPVQSTAEILSYVLGADLRQRGPMGIQSDIQIQGSTFDQVLVLIDGVRMSDPQTGHHQMNLSISPEAIERIEIIKGAAARRYGLNALAGVVNIITRQPVSASASLHLHAGSSGKQAENGKLYSNSSARFFSAFGGTAVQGWFDAAADNGSGYRHNSSFAAVRSSARLIQTIKHRLGFLKQDGFRLMYSASLLRNSFGANGFYAAPADSNAYEYVNTQWGAVTAEMNAKNGAVITARISARGNSDQYVFIKENPAYYRNFHSSSVLNPELNYRRAFKFWEIAAGAEYRKESINSSNLGEHLREFTGVYSELLLKPMEWLRISGGLYMLGNRYFGTKWYPGADVNARLGRRHYAFASAGTGQRLPTYTDLYYKGPGNLGNDALLPENALYMDAGIRSTGKHFGYQLSVFRRDNSQLIDRIRDSATGPWRPVNIQSFRVQGLEARLSYRIKLRRLFSASDESSIRLSSGISILDATQNSIAYASQFAIAYLPLQWISQVQLMQKSFSIGAVLRRVDRFGMQKDQRNTYAVVDARAEYKPRIGTGRPLKIWTSVQNAGNAEYREFALVPLLLRWTTLGLGWVF